MFKLQVEFETGNAAFDNDKRQEIVDSTYAAVTDALVAIAPAAIETVSDCGFIVDTNGNTIGKWSVQNDSN